MRQQAVRVLLVLAALTGLLGSWFVPPAVTAVGQGAKPSPIAGIGVGTPAPTRAALSSASTTAVAASRSTRVAAAMAASVSRDAAVIAAGGQGPRLLPTVPTLAPPPVPVVIPGPMLLLGQLPRPPDSSIAGSNLAARRRRSPPLSAGT